LRCIEAIASGVEVPGGNKGVSDLPKALSGHSITSRLFFECALNARASVAKSRS
jgi:hypothetical protein